MELCFVELSNVLECYASLQNRHKFNKPHNTTVKATQRKAKRSNSIQYDYYLQQQQAH